MDVSKKTTEHKKEKRPAPRVKKRKEKNKKSAKEKTVLRAEHMISTASLHRNIDRAERMIPSPSEYGMGRILNINKSEFTIKHSKTVSLYPPRKTKRDASENTRFTPTPAEYTARQEREEPEPRSGRRPKKEMSSILVFLPNSFAQTICPDS